MAYDNFRHGRSRRERDFGPQRESAEMGRYGYGRGYGRERMSNRDREYDRDDRDFFDRASDEVRSWFGDDRAERRREMDERMGYGGRGYVNREFEFESSPRHADEGYRRPYTGRRYERSPVDDDRFSRSRMDDERFERGRFEEGRFGSDDRYDYDRAYSQDRSSRGRTQSETTGMDSDYSSWRNRQIDALDRDYDEWRRENRKRFDNEFSSWRENRQQKRQLMREVPDHAEVVGNDGEHVGTVDKIRGERLILTKNDSDDGHHHSLRCTEIDCIEDGKVKLDISAEQAQQQWRDEDRERSLNEDYTRDEGPHMLNRSFADTY